MDNDEGKTSLEELDKKLNSALSKKEEESKKSSNSAGPGSMRVGVELMAGVFVGAGLGYFLDKWLDTLPIFFIIFFFFGVAAGALNIYKLAAGTGGEEKTDQNPEEN